MTKHYTNEAGVEIHCDTGTLIGSANAQFIKYLTPAQVEGTFNGSLFSSYSTLAGEIGTYFVKYTTTLTDITVPGEWRFQAVIGALSQTFFGETVKIKFLDRKS